MPRQGVKYVNNEEPAFIKQFKQKVGYKDGPDINAKRNIPNFDNDEEDDDNVPEREDEKPVIVVVKSGDLTSEEAETEQKQIEDGPARLNEKIAFKKPIKRSKESTENSTEADDVTKKQKKDSGKDKKSIAKKSRNSSLLSFDEEENDDA